MELTMSISSDKELCDYLDTEDSFESSIDEEQEYGFKYQLTFRDGEKVVAQSNGLILDEDAITNDEQDIVDIANMYDSDTYEAFSTLVKSKIFDDELDEDLFFEHPFSCYIDRLYVSPEYRNKGIATYIFENLYKIILQCLNVHIKCFVIFPEPDDEDKSDEMKKIMIKVIKDVGYKPLKDTGFFAINCMTQTI